MGELTKIIITVLITAVVISAIWYVNSLHRRISSLEKDADRRRHTQATQAGIMDTIADVIAWRIDLETDLERANSMLRKLQLLNDGPHSYPTGRKK